MIFFDLFERLIEGAEAIKFLGYLIGRLKLRYRLMLVLSTTFSGNKDYYPETCDEEQFNQILLLGGGFYQKATGMTESQSWARFHQTPGAFRAVIAVDRTTGEKTLAGYYVLFPLTIKAMKAIDAHVVEGSRHLREGDICGSFKKFSSLYVSAVYGRSALAQIFTSQWLLTDILQEKDRKPRLRYVFTRPTTPDGCAIFKALTGKDPEPGKIAAVDLDSALLRVRYRERTKRLRSLARAHKKRT